MRKISIAMCIIGFLVLTTSCSSQPTNASLQPTDDSSPEVITNTPQEEVEEVEEVEQTPTAEPLPTPTEMAQIWKASSPVAQFTAEDINFLGIQCSGEDADIADCILEWEKENFLFCVSPTGDDITPTCSALVETSEILPGILSSKDVIYNTRVEEKIPGLCLDYAVTYCSIAEYYGLQCRIVRSDNKYCEEVKCDEDDATYGWGEMEYAWFIKPLLDENDLPFTLESINAVAEDTWAHYWAEVLIDDEWEFMDASARDTANRYSQNDVVIVDWEEMDKSEEMYSFLNK